MHLKVLRSLAKRKKHERRTGSQALLKPLEGQETHGLHPQARNTPTVASPASAAGQHKRTGKTSVKPDVCCESPPVSALAHRPTVMCLNARHVGLKGPRVQTLGVYSSFLAHIGQECKHLETAKCSRSLFPYLRQDKAFGA